MLVSSATFCPSDETPRSREIQQQSTATCEFVLAVKITSVTRGRLSQVLHAARPPEELVLLLSSEASLCMQSRQESTLVAYTGSEAHLMSMDSGSTSDSAMMSPSIGPTAAACSPWGQEGVRRQGSCAVQFRTCKYVCLRRRFDCMSNQS